VVKVVWTRHAEERQKEWEKKLGITPWEVEDLVLNPQQVVPGDHNVLVSQAKRGKGLLRVLFIEEGTERRVLTLYWTSRIERYWKEE